MELPLSRITEWTTKRLPSRARDREELQIGRTGECRQYGRAHETRGLPTLSTQVRPGAGAEHKDEEQQDRQAHRDSAHGTTRSGGLVNRLGRPRDMVVSHVGRRPVARHGHDRCPIGDSDMVAGGDHKVVHADEPDDERANDGYPHAKAPASHPTIVTQATPGRATEVSASRGP